MLCIPCLDDDAEDTYRTLVLRTRSREVRVALLAETAEVGARMAEYLRLAENEELYRITSTTIGAIAAEMSGVYDRVMVKGAGRSIYNRIKLNAKYRLCPLCAQRDVKALDHYLPKQAYPEFSIFLSNLVPCCSDCNKIKGEYTSVEQEEQIFHPYFDDWSMHRLIRANVCIGERVNVSFDIRSASTASPETLARARKHFEVLELGALYSAGAAAELVESKDTFRRNFRSGPDSLRAELLYIAKSRGRKNINSWRAALYRGLAESDAFCEGGFERIEE